MSGVGCLCWFGYLISFDGKPHGSWQTQCFQPDQTVVSGYQNPLGSPAFEASEYVEEATLKDSLR